MSAITYRKTKAGEWVAYGPATAIRTGVVVTVAKKDGSTKTEHIASVGRAFLVNGTPMVYGYLAKAEQTSTAHSHAAAMCDECGQRRATTTARDMSGFLGRVCGLCARAGYLSFA